MLSYRGIALELKWVTLIPNNFVLRLLCNIVDFYANWIAAGSRVVSCCRASFLMNCMFDAAYAWVRRRSALPMTDTELKLIASAAMSGDSRMPVNGYSTPAAIGMPSAL